MKYKFFVLVLLITVLAACGQVPGSPQPGPGATPPAAGATRASAPPALEGTEWVVQSLRGQPLLAGTNVTVTFKDGQISGSAGCNSYGGSYEAQDGKLTVGQLAMTEMYCENPAGVMDQEKSFLAALGAVASYQGSAGQVELADAAGQAVLVLVSSPAKPEVALEGTEWVLTTFLEGTTASSLISGTEITLRFEQGDAGGSGGCNSYGGSYTRQDDTLEFGTLVSTMMACEGPAGLMQQEGKYLGLLQHVTSLALDGDQLTLRTAEGNGLVFRAR